jgi:hypothetical protein
MKIIFGFSLAARMKQKSKKGGMRAFMEFYIWKRQSLPLLSARKFVQY